MHAPRTPGQRAGLTRDAVLTAAQSLLAEHGLDGLTMRRLANRLGVAPNALYSHVSNKTALIDDLLDDTLAAVHTPDVDRTDPADGLTTIMTSTYGVLVTHSDLVPLYLARQGARGANAERLGLIMLRLLAQAGLTGDAAHEARRVLIVYTIGFAALATPSPVDADADTPLDEESVRANFQAGLRWLLAGILRPAPHT